MDFAIVSLSFPDGETLPERMSASPQAPIIPPCHARITASGSYSAINDMSVMLPVLKITVTDLKAFRTSLIICFSSSERSHEPALLLLSRSSPAVLPITIAAVCVWAAI